VEQKPAIDVGAAAAKTLERGVRNGACILQIGKAALRIGLPYLKHGIGDGFAVAVENLADDADTLAGDIRRDQIIAERVILLIIAARRQGVFEEGTNGLRRGYLAHQSLSSGVALRPRSNDVEAIA
jgi:hypothetical protein